MRYNLAGLAHRAGKRRRFRIDPVAQARKHRKSLEELALWVVRAWSDQAKARILPAYEKALSGFVFDDDAEDIRATLDAAEETLRAVVAEVTLALGAWTISAEQWHRERWSDHVKDRVGVDVYPYVNQVANYPQIKAYQERVTSLIRSVSDQARKDIEDIVWRGVNAQTPRRVVAQEIAQKLGLAKRRALFIAVDQSNKLSSLLTRIRHQEAGITHYEWVHSGKVHFREHHKARNGQAYQIGTPTGDEPGDAPYCGCLARAILEPQEG